MKKNPTVRFLVILFCALVLVGITYLVTYRTTLNRLTVKNITATQAANAMKNDDFYASYNENTLIIKAAITSVSKANGNLTIGLQNNSTYKTLCKMQNTNADIKVGDNVTVVAVGATAERQTNAVLLKNCVLP